MNTLANYIVGLLIEGAGGSIVPAEDIDRFEALAKQAALRSKSSDEMASVLNKCWREMGLGVPVTFIGKSSGISADSPYGKYSSKSKSTTVNVMWMAGDSAADALSNTIRTLHHELVHANQYSKMARFTPEEVAARFLSKAKRYTRDNEDFIANNRDFFDQAQWASAIRKQHGESVPASVVDKLMLKLVARLEKKDYDYAYTEDPLEVHAWAASKGREFLRGSPATIAQRLRDMRSGVSGSGYEPANKRRYLKTLYQHSGL